MVCVCVGVGEGGRGGGEGGKLGGIVEVKKKHVCYTRGLRSTCNMPKRQA